MCNLCELSAGATHPCLWGSGNTNSDVMIVTDCPTYGEDANLQPGINTKWLATELFNVGVKIEECYYTYAVKCTSYQQPKSCIKACRTHLMEEIREVQPKYILVLGNTALYALTGGGAITKVRGDVIEKTFDYGNVKILPVLHPSAVIKNMQDLSIFRQDLYYFKRTVDNNWDTLSDFKWRIVKSRADIYDYYHTLYLPKSHVASYDIETDNIKNTDSGKLYICGVAFKEEVFVFPWEHKKLKKAPADFPAHQLNTLFSTPHVLTVAQNAKFDNRWLRTRGVTPRVDFDTYLAAYALNNTLPHGLKYMAKVEFGAPAYDSEVKFDEDFDFDKLCEYCAMDCYYTRKLYPILRRRLDVGQPSISI